MARPAQFSIVFKIIIAVLILISLTAFILSRVFIRSQISTIQAELKTRGQTIATNLAYNSELGVLADDKEALGKLIKGVMQDKDVIYVSVLDKQGKIIAEMGTHDDNEGPNGTSYNFTSPIKTKVIPASLGPESVVLVNPEQLPEETIGMAHLNLSLTNLSNAIQDMRVKTLGLTIILIIIAFILSVFVTRLIMNPLSSLVEATEKIAAGDLTYKVKKYSEDEIGEVAVAFNEMTEKLKSTYENLEKRTKELESANKELKEAQYRIVQTSKMAAIGQLGAGVAHELNNPLGGVLGYAQFTLQKVRKPGFSSDDFATCQTYLEHIEREALRCKAIVENLLKFSRGPKVDMEDVDLNKVIKDTLPLTSHGLRTHKINIVENYDPDLPVIRGNFNKLQQVIVNMIINAEQAMPEGGQLMLATTTKRDSAGKPMGAVVEIQDSGCGIAPENLSHMFEPFYTTKINSRGTGLGLSISYEIIQEHRGEIKIESQVNKGTKFTIILPC